MKSGILLRMTLSNDCLTKLTKNNANVICSYSRADRCDNSAVYDESIISGMVIRHAIKTMFDIGPSNINFTKVAKGGFSQSFHVKINVLI